MGKMFPRNAGQIHFWVNKMLIWFLIYPDLVLYKNLNFFSFLSVFFFKVLRKLPNEIRVTGYSALLFFGEIIVQLDFGGILGSGVYHGIGDSSGTATQHHSPT